VINHVAVAVPSVAEAVKWYNTQFGFELIGNAIQHISRTSQPDGGIFRIYPETLNEVKIAYMATGNGVGFEIFEFPQEQEQREQSADRFQYSRGGFFHICVTDAQPLQLAERVVVAGGQMVGQAVELGRDASVGCLYVADPWGNVIEILSTSFERLAGRLMMEER
jgi:catechol 2,3-dioxygenase-like lactoylglutathione lyase family enzyme